MKFSFRNNILLLFALLSMRVIVPGLGTFKSNSKSQDTVFWVELTHKVLYETEQVLAFVSDIESSIARCVINASAFLCLFIQTHFFKPITLYSMSYS